MEDLGSRGLGFQASVSGLGGRGFRVKCLT